MSPTAEKIISYVVGAAAAVVSQLPLCNDTPAENILLTIAGLCIGKELLRTSTDKAEDRSAPPELKATTPEPSLRDQMRPPGGVA
jgi:hypothetical protein